MFYPVASLRRGGKFHLCWVADSWPLRFATITHRQLWSQDIRQICDDLMEVMLCESGRPNKRFSLRLSSQLMRGLVRLYQRKVTVFFGDLCMINAHVMKSTNRTRIHVTSGPLVPERHLELPRLVIEEVDDENRIVELLQNSNNVIANVQDITLKEPTLPENRLNLDDAFGELNQEQLDRTIEMMLVQDPSVQHSGLDLPDISASQDKSRLFPEGAQMERISEHDLSLIRKSAVADLTHGPDFEKEIPEISDIPIPEPPAPQMDNQGKELEMAKKPGEQQGNEKEKSDVELVLEDLEEPQVKRRKIKKVIIDQKIKLSSNYIRSRIENINVELRCEDSTLDIISALAPANILLNRAARGLGYQLSHLFARNLGTGLRSPVADREIEVMVSYTGRDFETAIVQPAMRSVLEKIDEAVEPADTTETQARNVSKQMEITDINIQDPQIGQECPDISILPTQRILNGSRRGNRDSENEPSTKRQRRSGIVSYSQQMAIEMSADANNENVSGNRQPDAERIAAMLLEAGLTDACEQHRVTDNQVTQKRNGSERSETPLGSLDRTKVSLGESEKTTESQKFLREEWGTHGTMLKIYGSIWRGVSPLDLRSLVAGGPAAHSHRLTAAKCFTSILKLKQHGFVNIIKDPNTNEITDILLGSRLLN